MRAILLFEELRLRRTYEAWVTQGTCLLALLAVAAVDGRESRLLLILAPFLSVVQALGFVLYGLDHINREYLATRLGGRARILAVEWTNVVLISSLLWFLIVLILRLSGPLS